FEDAIRIAISIGGDSDTLAAITGSIAQAYYGVPEDIKVKALTYLDTNLRAIYDDWSEFIMNKK
ncbi:MAG: ADP-ribosylglycohydrolase family protein, partial [Desulfotomaculaceae bacterium]|nr:ADP-ribosylglycohydrolase family protein [Desulfotomaculaceae bacterium]